MRNARRRAGASPAYEAVRARSLVLLGVAVLGLAAMAATPSEAAAQEVAATSRSSGMGDALTAGASGTSSIWHNPAGIAAALMYAAEAAYVWDGPSAINGLQVNLVDTKSNRHFGAALAFTYENGSPKGSPDREAFHVRGGLGLPLLDGMVKLGTALRYSQIKVDGKEELAALIVDAGVIIQPLAWLSVGVTGINLVNGGYDEQLPRGIATGLAFASLEYGFHLGGDVVFELGPESPDDARTWRAGFEYLIADLFPARAGFRYEEASDEKILTVGAGFRDAATSVGIDASYQHNLDDAADKSVVGSLSIYF